MRQYRRFLSVANDPRDVAFKKSFGGVRVYP